MDQAEWLLALPAAVVELFDSNHIGPAELLVLNDHHLRVLGVTNREQLSHIHALKVQITARAEHLHHMKAAMAAARESQASGGIPIGAVLAMDGEVLATGYNRCVQDGDPLLHAELDVLRSAARLDAISYKRCTLYTTSTPCPMSVGAARMYGIPRIVVGESSTFAGAESLLWSADVEVVDLNLLAAKKMLSYFIRAKPTIWKEAMGHLELATQGDKLGEAPSVTTQPHKLCLGPSGRLQRAGHQVREQQALTDQGQVDETTEFSEYQELNGARAGFEPVKMLQELNLLQYKSHFEQQGFTSFFLRELDDDGWAVCGVANPTHRLLMTEYITSKTSVVRCGGCHCGAVRFRVLLPLKATAWDCNCSICDMKRNTHIVVPARDFTLTTAPSALTSYRFGTRTAQHTFCATCGVVPFYIPRSNPDGYAVTVHCIDEWRSLDIEVKQFDGTTWDESYAKTGISQCSKV